MTAAVSTRRTTSRSRPDGAVWFTDPGYGIMSDYEGGKADQELPTAVYRVDPASAAVELVVTDLDRPNGLCFSPDGSRLYVVDSGATRSIHVYDVVGGRRHRRPQCSWT